MTTIRQILRWWLVALLAIASVGADESSDAGANADPMAAVAARLRQSREPAVLFVGNSYSFRMPAVFQREVAAKGRRVRVDQCTEGGWTLERHAASEETLRKIREGRWDVVVIQEQSRIPSLTADARDAMMLPGLKRLTGIVREAGAVPVLFQTWGYRDGDPGVPGDDFRSMTARLRDGYRAAAKAAGGLAVVPVGDVWERGVEQGQAARLFEPDGSHPSAFGDQVTARVFQVRFFPKPAARVAAPQPSP